MFKLQRPTTIKPSKDRERVDLKLSNFQAVQVPKTWDRLFISVLSVETGKTIAKLGKALVKNGNCQWTETVSESVYITRDDSSKGYEECLVKLIVSTGSTRSSALGEATINVAQYVGSRVSSSTVSQALKKCSYGTMLQLKVQCVIPKSRNSDEQSKYSNSQEMVQSHVDDDDDDDDDDDNNDSGSKSKYSDESTNSHVRLRSQYTVNTSDPHKSENQGISNSESEPDNNSFYSIERDNESFTGKTMKSVECNSYERRQQVSFEASPIHCNRSLEDDCISNQSSSSSRSYPREDSLQKRTIKRSSMNNNTGSSRNLLEAAEATIEELRAEAKMWERNARKLMIDLDMSRREFQNVSKKHAEVEMELKASYAENEGIKREVENLKRDLHKSTTKKKIEEDPAIQSDNLIQMQKVWESEVKYQQDFNASLSRQLRSSQESNVELVSVLQELEQTIEQQKMEIENLSSLKLEFKELETSITRNSEDNSKLLAQFEQLQESEKKLQKGYQLLEMSLRHKTEELENERKSHSEFLSRTEDDHRHILSVKEDEILRLEAKLSANNGNDVDLVREIDSMREKIDELERDCAELTDENLELILKLKDLNKSDIRDLASFDTVSNEHPTVSSRNESELSDPKFQFFHLGIETKDEASEEMRNSEFESSEHIQEIIKELRLAFYLVRKPWFTAALDENVALDDIFPDLNSASDINMCNEMSVDHVLTSLLELNKLLEMRIGQCEQLVQDHEIEVKEGNITIDKIKKDMEERVLEIQECEKSKGKVQERCEDLLKEINQKKSQLDHVESSLMSKEQEFDMLAQNHQELEIKVCELRENKIYREQNIELERKINELEKTSSALQEENMQLQVIISGLESRVRELEQENDICIRETDDFKNEAKNLGEEVRKLKIELESQILDFQQKTGDMSKECLGAREQCEQLKLENQKLEESAKKSELDNEELRSLHSKLNQENQELQKHQSSLADQLIESRKHLTDCFKKIETLEDHLAMLQEEFAESERRFQSEVDALVQQQSNHIKKLALDESLHQTFIVKETEMKTLEKEIEHLNRQIHEALKDKERISMEYSGEVSRLTAEKKALQASLQEVQSKSEIDLHESESKVQDLNEQLFSSMQNHEELMADHERVLKLLAHYKRSEEKHKTHQNDLELKFTICDYERQQLTKEMGILKDQLQNMSNLRDQISLLKSELEGCMLEKRRLELALHKVSGDYEFMKAENTSFSEKISSLHDITNELEECKRQNIALIEKLHKMEDELAMKSILSAENADLKDDLDEVKRGNMQFQKQMFILEEEKNECLKKAQTLEENLKAMEERYTSRKESSYNNEPQGESPFPVRIEHITKHTLTDGKSTSDDGFVARARYERTKSSLETELRELRERYLEMSLKYAEVEAEREDLVMKLKATKSGKRWFA